MADNPIKSLFIMELIRRVHQELLDSKKERERDGQEAIFEVEKLTVEVNFVVTEEKTAKGGLDFKVITADVGKQYQQQQIHKITLSLTALPSEGLGSAENSISRFRPRED
jgi:hypothetical protein